MAAMTSLNPALQAWGWFGEYMTDAAQRTILFWDVLRQRSTQYYAQENKEVPHVLSFDAELVLGHRARRGSRPRAGHPRRCSPLARRCAPG